MDPTALSQGSYTAHREKLRRSMIAQLESWGAATPYGVGVGDAGADCDGGR